MNLHHLHHQRNETTYLSFADQMRMGGVCSTRWFRWIHSWGGGAVLTNFPAEQWVITGIRTLRTCVTRCECLLVPSSLSPSDDTPFLHVLATDTYQDTYKDPRHAGFRSGSTHVRDHRGRSQCGLPFSDRCNFRSC